MDFFERLFQDPTAFSVYVTNTTVIFGLITFAATIAINIRANKENKLEDIILRVFSGSAIPTGIVLLVCAFKPSLISLLEGLNIHIAAAGLVLLFVSTKAVFSR